MFVRKPLHKGQMSTTGRIKFQNGSISKTLLYAKVFDLRDYFELLKSTEKRELFLQPNNTRNHFRTNYLAHLTYIWQSDNIKLCKKIPTALKYKFIPVPSIRQEQF